jgi:hypothetical protein
MQSALSHWFLKETLLKYPLIFRKV